MCIYLNLMILIKIIRGFIRAEPKLFELYHMDRRVLLRLKAIDALQRKESAQALYTYIESLP